MSPLAVRISQIICLPTAVLMMAGCLVGTGRFNPYIAERRPVIRYTHPVNPQTGEVATVNHALPQVIHHDVHPLNTFAPPAGRHDPHVEPWHNSPNGVIHTSASFPPEPHLHEPMSPHEHEYTTAPPNLDDALVFPQFDSHVPPPTDLNRRDAHTDPAPPKPEPTPATTESPATLRPTLQETHASTFKDMTLVRLRGGTFVMGSPETEIGRNSQLETQRTVSVQPFSIGQTEVTRKQYWRVMEPTRRVDPAEADLPVANVSWDDAVKFCLRMTATTGRTVRLPTEAEWEYACRAGETSLFAMWPGNLSKDVTSYRDNVKRPLTRAASKLFNFDADISRALKTVRSYESNAWKLFDMHGNVWEWCAASSEAPRIDARPIRGGGWRSSVLDCRSANRAFESRSQIRDSIGFRVVAEPPKTPSTDHPRSPR